MGAKCIEAIFGVDIVHEMRLCAAVYLGPTCATHSLTIVMNDNDFLLGGCRLPLVFHVGVGCDGLLGPSGPKTVKPPTHNRLLQMAKGW